jgi:hypothetical protein
VAPSYVGRTHVAETAVRRAQARHHQKSTETHAEARPGLRVPGSPLPAAQTLAGQVAWARIAVWAGGGPSPPHTATQPGPVASAWEQPISIAPRLGALRREWNPASGHDPMRSFHPASEGVMSGKIACGAGMWRRGTRRARFHAYASSAWRPWIIMDVVSSSVAKAGRDDPGRVSQGCGTGRFSRFYGGRLHPAHTRIMAPAQVSIYFGTVRYGIGERLIADAGTPERVGRFPEISRWVGGCTLVNRHI